MGDMADDIIDDIIISGDSFNFDESRYGWYCKRCHVWHPPDHKECNHCKNEVLDQSHMDFGD